MRRDFCLYPYHMEARKLPVFLTGLGGTAYQQPVRRPEGYFWHQLTCCLQGSGVLEAGGMRYEVCAGDAFFLPAGVAHAYWPTQDKWETCWFTFDGFAAFQLLQQLELEGPVFVRGGGTTPVRSAMEQMLTAQTTDRLHGDYACSGLVYSCILAFHRALSGGAEENLPLRRAMACVERDYAQELSLTRLAGEAGVTPQHLCRLFRTALRMSPNDYIIQRRIQAAQKMIQAGELSLAEIAGAAGFSSAGYFSTVFRRCVGMSPSEYRRRVHPGAPH